MLLPSWTLALALLPGLAAAEDPVPDAPASPAGPSAESPAEPPTEPEPPATPNPGPEAEAEAEAHSEPPAEAEPSPTPNPGPEVEAPSEPAAEAAADVSFPRLPQVERPAAAIWPAQALEARREATVLLEVDLDAQGAVLDARVVEPAGEGFDEAAQDALLAFVFRPALDERGRPVPATLQYRYAFRLDALPVRSVEGLLRAAGTREPLAGARVVASGPDGATRVTSTSARATSPSWTCRPARALDVAVAGYDAQRVEVEVVDGKVGQAQLWLKPQGAGGAGRAHEELVVQGDRLDAEVSQRSLRADEIRVQPGSAGDVVRAIQSLPGMARPPFNAGQLLVRGTGPQDSGFYLGGSRIPLVFHFGGLATVVNADSLSDVRFLPGNYGVRYGRHLGGVIDLQTDRELPARSGGYAAVDLFQSTLFVEQTVGGQTAVTLSGRRSYIDGVLAPLVNQQTSADIRLPRYADVQARLHHKTRRGRDLDALLLVSDDRSSLEGDGVAYDSKVVLAFQKGWLRWEAPLAGGWQAEHTFLLGPERRTLQLGEESAFDQTFTGAWRSEVNRPVPAGGVVGWRLGVDTEVEVREFDYEFEDLGGYAAFGEAEDGSAVVLRPGMYLEQTQRAGRLEGVPGVRLDLLSVWDRYSGTRTTVGTADPRFALRYTASEETKLHATVGRYSQFPQVRELLVDANGEPGLGPEWSLATSVGVAQALGPRLSVEATAYGSWLFDLIVGREDRFEFELGPLWTGPVDTGPYENAGRGRIGGLETLLRYEDDRTIAWLGLTASRSERWGRDATEPRRFQYDQPLVATLVASRALPRRWQLGGRFRFGSGNPYYAVDNRVYALDERAWVPIFAEEPSRMPAYWTLDLRVDKRYVFRAWALTTYLDLMNATDRRNQELVNWTADFGREVPVYGLPIVPAFGLRGEW